MVRLRTICESRYCASIWTGSRTGKIWSRRCSMIEDLDGVPWPASLLTRGRRPNSPTAGSRMLVKLRRRDAFCH
jgi:hypothetical protein